MIDAFSRKVVGWSMSDRITEKVAIDAIEQAAGREDPLMMEVLSFMTQDIFKYIELYYNRVRMHSYLGYMSPDEYERKCA